MARKTVSQDRKIDQRQLPEIEITTAENEVVDEAIAALASDESIYQRGGVLVRVARDEMPESVVRRTALAPWIQSLPLPSLREKLAASARWLRFEAKRDELVDKHPPQWVVAEVAARGSWPSVRRLEGVVEAPVLRPDGTVLHEPGYDPATELLLEPNCEIFPPNLDLTIEDAREGVKTLLAVVRDFPFAGEPHRSAWLAALLTPFARHAFAGPAPIFLVEANIRGSGKTLLVDLISIILTGREAAKMIYSHDPDEMRKKITTIAIAGDPLVLLDNVTGQIGGGSLDAALTGSLWADRLLGKNEGVRAHLHTIWYATGNNCVVVGDTVRRTIYVRLSSPLEKPEERENFANKNLRRFVHKQRPFLIEAVLKILRAFCAAGRPKQNVRPLGSFEGWDLLVRHALVWAGQPDPGLTRIELAGHADMDAAAVLAFVSEWSDVEAAPGAGATAAQLAERLAQPNKAEADPFGGIREATAHLARDGASPSARSLGARLNHLRGRVAGGRCIDSRRGRNNTQVWFVRDFGAGTEGTTGTISSPGTSEPIGVPLADGAKDSPQSPQSPDGAVASAVLGGAT